MRNIMFIVVAGLVLALASASSAAIFTDNFDTPHNYLTDGLGAYDGLLDGGGSVTMNVLETDPCRPGELYIATDNSMWGGGGAQGVLLYKEITGDFVATVKVTDFAGNAEQPVFHNWAGILARNPDGELENWVSVDYFPTWTAFIAWSVTDNDRPEFGQTARRWTGDDTYAIAEAYPWIQLERVGADFHFRVSADGVTFLPLTDPAYQGIYDGTQDPLVINRPDLPETLQVGLTQGGTNGTGDQTGGFVVFDDFSIMGGFDFDPAPANGETVAVTDSLTLSWLNLPPDPCSPPVLIDVYWDTEADGSGGTQVLTESPAAMTVDVSAPDIGTYYWKIVATDPNTSGDPYVMAEVLYSVIAIDGCEFAQTKTELPYTETAARLKGDTNYDCKVDLVDFAALAKNWLNNLSF
ncbi:MAG: DUF1349 domain-containing protein [Planctomycetes bacterium]|nr:DUF1349 domain-containing protein [Planctomycetota bacterium]